MWRKIYPPVIYFCLTFSLICPAQQKSEIKKDSAGVYRNIESLSKKNKVYKFIYGQLFRTLPPNVSGSLVSEVKKKIIAQQYYSRFEGKIIRNIEIASYDPFGYDSKDTSRVPRSLLEKGGNAVHARSMHLTIKKLLIVKKNEQFDSLRVRESERLIRSQRFINEVIFRPVLTDKNSDSVDIFIRVYDVWSIIVITDISKLGLSVDIKDKNFLGLGHEFQNVYSKKYNTGEENYRATYFISNIRNMYISSLVSFNIDEKNNYDRILSINRPFYSAFAKWAGGAYYQKHFNRSILYDLDSIPFNQNYKSRTHDYWTGKAWHIQRGLTENARTTQLILTGRVFNIHYLEKPLPEFDSLRIYSNETFCFASIGLSRRRYDQDRYIFRYGNIEDVPVGKAYSIVSGYQIKNNTGRYYMGARAYWGQYHPWGYFSTNIEYGTFIHRSSQQEGSLTFAANYFTNTFNVRKWMIRQFVKPQCTFGFNRLTYENLSINNELGIRGFNSLTLSGKSQKIVITLQTQSYAPWNVLGFRFGPYFISSFGMLGTDLKGFTRSPVYSQYGVGLLIRNEYLIYHSIQISIAFYPTIPGTGDDIFKINPVKTTDFGFRDFEVGRPSTVPYQ